MSTYLSPNRTLSGKEYFFTALILFGVKYNIDRLVAWVGFRVKWSVLDYFMNPLVSWSTVPDSEHLRLLLTLGGISLPFLGLAVILTMRRLSTVRLPLWLFVFLFIPLVNILTFLVLTFLPEQDSPRSLSFEGIIPEDPFQIAVCSVVLVPFVGLILVFFSTVVLQNYGASLFLGTPFLMGVCSSLLFGFHKRRTVAECMGVATTSVFVLGALLLCLAVEGLICILMAVPVSLCFAWLGAGLGYALQATLIRRSGHALLTLPVLVPALMLVEVNSREVPQPRMVTTVLDIEAPPQVVWKNVVEFSELPPPKDWLFYTGVAYPLRARINGRGVGSIRHCEFSTGPFVEPITVWNEPELLRFQVTESPPPMNEWSPFSGLKPPHIEGFFKSVQGEFKLEALKGGRTRLKGTTWYVNRVWPEEYWHFISSVVIRRIHGRVLRHIRGLSEGER